jgi:hypothetical protein
LIHINGPCSNTKRKEKKYIEKNPWERDIDENTQMPIGVTFHILNKFSFPIASKVEELTSFDIIKRKESFISYQRVVVTYFFISYHRPSLRWCHGSKN